MRRSPVRHRSRLIDIVAGLAALLSLIVLVGGIPAALYRLGGNPFGNAPRSWHALSEVLLKRDVTGTLFIHALVLVGWIAWATFALSVLTEIAARLRGRRTMRLPGLGMPQKWAAGLITAVTLAFSSPVAAAAAMLPIAPPPAVMALTSQPAQLSQPGFTLPPASAPMNAAMNAAASASASNPAAGVSAAGASQDDAAAGGSVRTGSPYGGSVVIGSVPMTSVPMTSVPMTSVPMTSVPMASGTKTSNGSTPLASVVSTASHPPAQLVYEVRHGDYLGAIAERFGGSFDDAKLLARTNHIDDPNMIQIGWRIKLPAGAQDTGPRAHANGKVFKPASGGSGGSSQGAGNGASGSGANGNGANGGGAGGSGAGGSAAGGSGAGAANSGQTPGGTHGSTAPGSRSGHDSGVGSVIVDMLEASGTLAAVVALSLVVIRKREQLQHRLARNVSTASLGAGPPRLMAATRAEDIVRLDTALRLLADEVQDWPVEDIPQIAGVWLDQGATTLLLADECRVAPAPFIDDDNGWLLPAAEPIRAAADQIAPLPALCTVGGRANQHVLLDLEYLRMLGIGGDRAEALNLLRFLVVELCHNVWSDDVRVTLAGFGAEMSELAAIDPIRVRTRPTVAGAIDEFGRQLAQAVAVLDDIRTPEVLVIANPEATDRQALASLERQLMGAPGVGMSVVVGPTPDGYSTGRYQMSVRSGGDLHIGFLGDAIVPAAALPVSLLPEVVSLLGAARVAGDRTPLDLARTASKVTRASATIPPVRLAGQHRHDGDRRSFRDELSDLTSARHVRPAGLSWNT